MAKCPKGNIWQTLGSFWYDDLRKGRFSFGDKRQVRPQAEKAMAKDFLGNTIPTIQRTIAPAQSLPPQLDWNVYNVTDRYYEPSGYTSVSRLFGKSSSHVRSLQILQRSENVEPINVPKQIQTRIVYAPGTAIHELRTNETLTGVYKQIYEKMEKEASEYGAAFVATVQPMSAIRHAAKQLGAIFDVWQKAHQPESKRALGLYTCCQSQIVVHHYNWITGIHELMHHVDHMLDIMDVSHRWESIKDDEFHTLWYFANKRYGAKWAQKSYDEASGDPKLKMRFQGEGWTTLNELLIGHPDGFDVWTGERYDNHDIMTIDLDGIEKMYSFIREHFPEIFQVLVQLSTLSKYMARLSLEKQYGFSYLDHAFKNVAEKASLASRIAEKIATTASTTLSPDTGWAIFTSRLIGETYGIKTWLARIPLIGPLLQIAKIASDPVLHGQIFRTIRSNLKERAQSLRAKAHYAFAYPSKEAQQALYSLDPNNGWNIYADEFFWSRYAGVEDAFIELHRRQHQLVQQAMLTQQAEDRAAGVTRPLNELIRAAQANVGRQPIWSTMPDGPTWNDFLFAQQRWHDTTRTWPRTHERDQQLGQYIVLYHDTLAKIKRSFVVESGSTVAWDVLMYLLQLNSFIHRAKTANERAARKNEDEPILPSEIEEYEAHARAMLDQLRHIIKAEKPNYSDDKIMQVINRGVASMRDFFNTYLAFALMSNTLNLASYIAIYAWHKDSYAPLQTINIEASFLEEGMISGMKTFPRPDIRAIKPKVPVGRAFVPRGPWKPIEETMAARIYGAYTAMYTGMRNYALIQTLDRTLDDIDRRLSGGNLSTDERKRLLSLRGIIRSLYIKVDVERKAAAKVRGSEAIKQLEDAIIAAVRTEFERINMPFDNEVAEAIRRALQDGSIQNMTLHDTMPSIPDRVGLLAIPHFRPATENTAFIGEVWNYDYYVIQDAFLYKLLVSSPSPLDILNEAAETKNLLHDMPEIYSQTAAPFHYRFRRLVTRNVRYIFANITRDAISAMIYGKNKWTLVPLLPLINGIFRLWQRDTRSSMRAIDTYVQTYRERMMGTEVPTAKEIFYLYKDGEVDLAWDGIKRWLKAEFPGTQKVTVAKLPFIVLSALGWPIELAQRMLLYLINLSTKVAFKGIDVIYPTGLKPDVTPEIFELAARTWAYEEDYKRTHDHALATFEQDWITGTFSTHGTNFFGRVFRLVPFANAFMQIAVRMPITMMTSANPDDQFRFLLRALYLALLAMSARFFWWLMYGHANGDEELKNTLKKIQNLPTESKVRFTYWGPFRIPNDEFVPGLIMGLSSEVIDNLILNRLADTDHDKEFNNFAAWRAIKHDFYNIVSGFPIIGRVLSPEIKTFIEMMQNYSFLYHREIIPMYIKDLPPEYIVPHDTSRSIEELSKLMRMHVYNRISPAHLDYVIRGIYGSHSRELINALGRVIYNEEPLQKAFVNYVTGATTKNLEPYGRYSLGYTALEDIEQEYQTVKKTIDLALITNRKVSPEIIEKWSILDAGHSLFWDIESHIRKIYELRKTGGSPKEIEYHQKEAARLGLHHVKAV
ncbi:MAG: hypothetical protein KatS3mg087_1105 [Patescibacteria group bacterium]|nr:MAG: hypothetical protein KatS3mg087_1105 [Patescibacteria group bacterium]